MSQSIRPQRKSRLIKNGLVLKKAGKAAFQKVSPLVRTRRQKLIVAGVGIALSGLAGYYILGGFKPDTVAGEPGSSATPQEALQVPDYATILPGDKTIQDLGGWTRVSPADRNAVFAFVDKINDSPINISQQPLPDDFKQDTDTQVEYLAKGFKATKKLNVGDTTVYIGTSVKGPQSVIFTRDDLLIFIKSTVPVNDDQWSQYVNALR